MFTFIWFSVCASYTQMFSKFEQDKVVVINVMDRVKNGTWCGSVGLVTDKNMLIMQWSICSVELRYKTSASTFTLTHFYKHIINTFYQSA